MAAKVHPNAAGVLAASRSPVAEDEQQHPPAVLTVWRKSLLFNCDGFRGGSNVRHRRTWILDPPLDGFTVFDAKGDLAFRVDSYSRGRSAAEVVLMDVAGKPLLTVRRKRWFLSLADQWLIYDKDNTNSRPILSIRRHVSLRRSSSASKAVAHVTSSSSAEQTASYVVEGSYGRRACALRDANGDAVAEVRRKESVGDDVFRLVADPRLGAPMAMGLVVALDDMFRKASSSSSGSARSLLRTAQSMVMVRSKAR